VGVTTVLRTCCLRDFSLLLRKQSSRCPNTDVSCSLLFLLFTNYSFISFSENIWVTTNCFQEKYTAPLDSDAVWHQYMINMVPKKFVPEAQMIGDGELPPIVDIPDAHLQKVQHFQGSIQKYGLTELSREILKRLSRLLEREEDLILAVRMSDADRSTD
jgi:hypothetical protein